jgi:hypothetical protein
MPSWILGGDVIGRDNSTSKTSLPFLYIATKSSGVWPTPLKHCQHVQRIKVKKKQPTPCLSAKALLFLTFSLKADISHTKREAKILLYTMPSYLQLVAPLAVHRHYTSSWYSVIPLVVYGPDLHVGSPRLERPKGRTSSISILLPPSFRYSPVA